MIPDIFPETKLYEIITGAHPTLPEMISENSVASTRVPSQVDYSTPADKALGMVHIYPGFMEHQATILRRSPSFYYIFKLPVSDLGDSCIQYLSPTMTTKFMTPVFWSEGDTRDYAVHQFLEPAIIVVHMMRMYEADPSAFDTTTINSIRAPFLSSVSGEGRTIPDTAIRDNDHIICKTVKYKTPNALCKKTFKEDLEV